MKRKQSFILIAPPGNFGGPVLFVPLDDHQHHAVADEHDYDEPAPDVRAEPEKTPAMNWIRNAVAQARRLPAAVRIPRWRWSRKATRTGI